MASVGPTVGGWAIASDISEWIEVVAVATISVTVVIALLVGVRVAVTDDVPTAIGSVKRNLGRGLLLGLDLLIAADVIRTVTLEPTLENVAALGLLVVVRTFLSWALIVELTGHWPWRMPDDEVDDPSGN
jgi:uncharacterized membrane protein